MFNTISVVCKYFSKSDKTGVIFYILIVEKMTANKIERKGYI
jgi:hypothetical protein